MKSINKRQGSLVKVHFCIFSIFGENICVSLEHVLKIYSERERESMEDLMDASKFRQV
jgi:hypothetical protein